MLLIDNQKQTVIREIFDDPAIEGLYSRSLLVY